MPTARTFVVYVAGLAAIAVFVWGGARIRQHPSLEERASIWDIRGIDEDSAIVERSGRQTEQLARIDADGRERWMLPFQGNYPLHSLKVTRSAVFLRYADRDDNEWVERVDLDGRRRWRHLIASHENLSADTYEVNEEPTVVGTVLIEEVRLDAQHRVLAAFDASTGWPLWEMAAPDWAVSQSVAAPWVIDANYDHVGIVDARHGTYSRVTVEAEPCVLDKQVWTVRHDPKHDELVVADAAVTTWRHAATLRTFTDHDHYSVVVGCAKYGSRRVILIGRSEHGIASTILLELDDNGAIVVDAQLPDIDRAVIADARGYRSARIASTLTRFIPISVKTHPLDQTLAIVDLEDGHVVWSSRSKHDFIEIIGEGERWYARQRTDDPPSTVLFSIDGRSGAISAAARSKLEPLETSTLAGSTIWVRTRDHEDVVPIDGVTLAPRGLRAHVVAFFKARVPRPLQPADVESIGL